MFKLPLPACWTQKYHDNSKKGAAYSSFLVVPYFHVFYWLPGCISSGATLKTN